MEKQFFTLNVFSFLLISSLFLPASDLSGQESQEFKPGGKPEARVFTSLNTSFSNRDSHTKFDLTRAYLGYTYNFSKALSGRIVYDVADPTVGKLKFTGMLKFAYLRYQTDKLTITGGMIPLPEYDFGDRKWGHRYVYKPFHDEYGFGTSADLGASIAYNIAPWITADLTVMNGEGFKLTESDSTFKIAAGLTLQPLKNFSLRFYFDNMSNDGISQKTTEIIAAYENKGSVLSVAYNFRRNNGLTEGHDYQGFSINGTLAVKQKIRVFGRYDYLSSVTTGNDPDPWNIMKDGQLILTGIELGLAPGVNISPNFLLLNPADKESPVISRFSISLDLKF